MALGDSISFQVTSLISPWHCQEAHQQMKKQAQRGRAAGLRPHSSHGQGGVWLQGCPPGRPGFPQGHESGASRGSGGSLPHKAPGCVVSGVEETSARVRVPPQACVLGKLPSACAGW